MIASGLIAAINRMELEKNMNKNEHKITGIVEGSIAEEMGIEVRRGVYFSGTGHSY